MDSRIERIVESWTRYCNERGLSDSCRHGKDPQVTKALEQLGISPDSALTYLFQHLLGPFSSTGERRLPELLDITNGVRTIVSFSAEFWDNYSAPKNLLAISEIDTMTGLFYDIERDCVFQVEMDLEFPQFLNGELKPQWSSSVEFLVDFFGEEAIGGAVE